MRNDYLAKFVANVLDRTKYWAWGYNDVIVHGDGLNKCDGALLIPNHIEAGDTVAIGTAVYKETGMPPYFVMKSSLPFSPVLEAAGGIPWSRSRELQTLLRRNPGQKAELVHAYRAQRDCVRSQVADITNNGGLVTMYLQGTRTPEGKTVLGSGYTNSLKKWIAPMNADIVPVNIYHSFKSDGRRVQKVVNLDFGDPVHSGEGLETIVDRLCQHIDVFEKA